MAWFFIIITLFASWKYLNFHWASWKFYDQLNLQIFVLSIVYVLFIFSNLLIFDTNRKKAKKF